MTDTTTIVQAINGQTQVLSSFLKVLLAGIAVEPVPSTFTVATLPTTGVANGQYAFASNGRKPGEGAAAGTGVPVFWNGATSTWFSYCSGAVVTA